MIKKEVKKLNNGLKHVHYQIPFLNSIQVSFLVNTGAVNEDTPELHGISHFLEHLIASWKSPLYKSVKKAEEEINKRGISYNAYTSLSVTNYYHKTTPESLEFSIEMIAKAVFEPVLTSKNVKKEIGIIQEEIGGADNSPYREAYFSNIINGLVGTNYDHRILGTKESVGNMTVDLLTNYHKTQYAPNNVVVITYGSTTFKETHELVKQYTAKYESQDTKVFSLYKDEKLEPDTSKVELNMDVDSSIVALSAFNFEKFTIEKYVNLKLLSTIFSSGNASKFKQDLQLESAVVSYYSADIYFNKKVSQFLFMFALDSSKLEDLNQYLEDLLHNDELEITKSQFNRAKGYLNGSILRSLEGFNYINGTDSIEVINQYEDTDYSIDDLISEMHKVEYEDFMKFTQNFFNNSYFKRSEVYPKI